MFDVDPAGYLSALGAGMEEERARDAANHSIAQQALQAGEITRDQYGEFLAMPRAERSKFAAGISVNFVDKWKQGELNFRRIIGQMNPSSWASGIFGEPVRDPRTGAWGIHDVRGSFQPFTPTPTPTPTPATPTSGRSMLDKILSSIFGAFGAPSPSGPAPTPMPTPQPTPMPTPAPQRSAKTVLMKWPDGVTQFVPAEWVPNALKQGATPLL